MSRKIYLDYAAATPLDPKVYEAMQPFFISQFYNPSAIYLSAKQAAKHLQVARSSIAGLIGARPAEIIFTAGATEANNLSIQGIGRRFERGEILTSAIEHDSVIEPAKLFNSKQIPVDKDGTVLLNKLSNLITDKTTLISVMLVNNELGTIQPLKKIADLVAAARRTRRAANNSLPLYLHTDAAQAGNYLDLHVSRLGVDLMSLNGGKIYGPKQSGVLYIKAGTKLQPLIVGGGQEFGLRSGTENIAAAAGFSKALEIAQSKRAVEQKRVSELRDYFEAELLDKIRTISLNGPKHHRAPHISNLSFEAADNERLIMELDERGIECAAGSACSAGSDELSHVLSAIGLSPEESKSSLRFSFGKLTSLEDIKRTVAVLVDLAASNR